MSAPRAAPHPTRARDLRNMRIEGLERGLRKVVKSSWRAVAFAVAHEKPVPPASKAFAGRCQRDHERMIG